MGIALVHFHEMFIDNEGQILFILQGALEKIERVVIGLYVCHTQQDHFWELLSANTMFSNDQEIILGDFKVVNINNAILDGSWLIRTREFPCECQSFYLANILICGDTLMQIQKIIQIILEDTDCILELIIFSTHLE